MNRRLGLVGVLWIGLISWTGAARAQAPRGGSAVNPDGELYNVNSPEYQKAGGDPFRLQDLLKQKLRQQQAEAAQRPQKPQAARSKPMQGDPRKNPEAQKKSEQGPKKRPTSPQARPATAGPTKPVTTPQAKAKPNPPAIGPKAAAPKAISIRVSIPAVRAG